MGKFPVSGRSIRLYSDRSNRTVGFKIHRFPILSPGLRFDPAGQLFLDALFVAVIRTRRALISTGSANLPFIGVLQLTTTVILVIFKGFIAWVKGKKLQTGEISKRSDHLATDWFETKRMVTDSFGCEYAELTIAEKILRYVITAPLIRHQVDTLFTREPTTPPWIESFDPGDVFIDVGANVGLYSIYAAIMASARVYSFEPESQNYAELNKNIFINGLHNLVTAYCLALSNVEEISCLHLCTFAAGFGHHDFGANSWKEDLHRNSTVYPKDRRLLQGSIGMTLDSLVESGILPHPNHIKIDVDGFEWKVLEGSYKTLCRPELKTVLIETDFSIQESVDTIHFMTDHGWCLSYDQLRVFEHEVVAPEVVMDRLKRGVGQQNFIYFRDEKKYHELFAKFAAMLDSPQSF